MIVFFLSVAQYYLKLTNPLWMTLPWQRKTAEKLPITWVFVQAELDVVNFGSLHRCALVRAGQSTMPCMHKALFVMLAKNSLLFKVSTRLITKYELIS